MPSEPEEHFALLWQAAGGLEADLPLTPELQWHPTRKWRADFALPSKQVLIEIEGGVHSNGRHSRGTGFTADAVKYFEASLMGWHTIRLVPSQLDLTTIERLLAWILKKPQPSPAISTTFSRIQDGNGLPARSKRGKRTSAKN